MKGIFVGFLFIFFDFSITGNGHLVSIIPDFLGYLIIMRTAKELSKESIHFTKIRPFAIFMAIYSFLLFLLDLFAITGNSLLLKIPLTLLDSIGFFYLCYLIILGIKDMELTYQANFNAQTLLRLWKWDLILHLCFALVPVLPMPMILTLFLLIAIIVINIMFLMQLYGATKQYDTVLKGVA